VLMGAVALSDEQEEQVDGHTPAALSAISALSSATKRVSVGDPSPSGGMHKISIVPETSRNMASSVD